MKKLISICFLIITTIGVEAQIVAHYNFENNVNDTANSNNGTISGNPTYETGIDGQALSLDGVDDYITIPSNSEMSVTQFTISALINIPNSVQSGWRAIVEHGRSTDSWYGLFKASSGNKFHLRWGPSHSTDFNTEISPDTWYHVVATYDGTKAVMYLNGIEDKEDARSSGLTAIDSQLRIGANFSGTEAFKGIIDDLRIYNTALTATEVSNLYNSYSLPGNTEPTGSTVTKVGTPENGQIAVWTGDGTIEGSSNFNWDSDIVSISSRGLQIRNSDPSGDVPNSILFDLDNEGNFTIGDPSFSMATGNYMSLENSSFTVYNGQAGDTVLSINSDVERAELGYDLWVHSGSIHHDFVISATTGQLYFDDGSVKQKLIFPNNGAAYNYTLPSRTGTLALISDFYGSNGTTYLGEKTGTSGNDNIFIGKKAGKANTLGFRNVFIGKNSGLVNTTGYHNTFLGSETGKNSVGATNNTFIGTYSGSSNIEGNGNVFIGSGSGSSNTVGDKNLFVGSGSGSSNVSGEANVFLGNSAGEKNIGGSNNVFIGAKAGYNETGSNKLYIDNSDTTSPLVYGDFSTNQLGINTNQFPTGYTLAVGGRIAAEEVKVVLRESDGTWPDYVFTKTYNLPTLKELEAHITEKGHLPNIPSAKEVEANGIQLGEMNAKLLEKIEELTLYIIQQQKLIESQSKEIDNIKQQLKAK